MGKKIIHDSVPGQLKKYAEDFAKIYSSEKAKRGELKTAYRQLAKYADDLNSVNQELKKKNRELQESNLDTIHRLVLAAEYKDEDTGDHIVRMSRYSRLIGEKFGLSSEDIENLYSAAPMHDIGKIGIPDIILNKPGKLTDQEFSKMQDHPSLGAKILANSKYKIIQIAQQISISHHEKWNGKGYPLGLAGEKIPLFGRIVCLADVFDALTSRRPYKDPYPVETACGIVEKEREKHFDPEIAEVFLDNIDEIVKIKEEVDSSNTISLSDFTWSERDLDET